MINNTTYIYIVFLFIIVFAHLLPSSLLPYSSTPSFKMSAIQTLFKYVVTFNGMKTLIGFLGQHVNGQGNSYKERLNLVLESGF